MEKGQSSGQRSIMHLNFIPIVYSVVLSLTYHILFIVFHLKGIWVVLVIIKGAV